MQMDQRVMNMLIQGAQEKYGVQVNESDLDLCRRWINHMIKKGTEGLKIADGDQPNTWVVQVHGELED